MGSSILLPDLETLRPAAKAPIPSRLDKRRILGGLLAAAEPAAAGTSAMPVYSARSFGARGDGVALDTQAIQAAVDAAASAGGGVAYLAPGVYLCGGVELKTNVTLYLEAGAYLWGAAKREHYVHPRGHLVFALDADNAAVRGRGTVYGNADDLMAFPAKGEPYSDRLMPVGPWRAERCLHFERCTNLLIEDVTVRHTPEWAVHLRRCERVRISGLSIINGVTHHDDYVANGDGLDIDTCAGVRVSDCFVQSGDDSICLKIEEPDGPGVAQCRDIVVCNCTVRTTQTGIKLGTGSYGEFRNVVISNCTVQDGAGGIGLWVRDGGLIDGVRIDQITICQETDEQHGTAFFFRGYRRGKQTPRDGLIRNVCVTNVTANSHGALFMAGPDTQVFRDMEFRNIRFNIHGRVPRAHATTPPHPYSTYSMNETPYEFYVHNARDLRLENISFAWDANANPAWTHAMRFINVNGLTVDGFTGRQGGGDAPAVLLRNVSDAWLRNSAAAPGTGTFLALEGSCPNVRLSGNDFSRARVAVSPDMSQAGAQASPARWDSVDEEVRP